MKYIATLLLLFAATVAHGQPVLPDPKVKPLPIKVKPAPAKIAPAFPKAGKIVTITTTAESPLFDFDGVFAVDEASQVNGSLVIAAPVLKEDKTYLVRILYVWEGKIQVEKVNLKVIGTDGPQPVDPVPGPNGSVAKEIKALTVAVTKLAERVAALEGPKPPPQPNVGIVKHITFIGAEGNPASLAINNNAELRDWLKTCGIAVHVMQADSEDIAAKGMSDAVKKVGGPPCAILQSAEGKILAQGPMQSVEAIKAMATPFIKR